MCIEIVIVGKTFILGRRKSRAVIEFLSGALKEMDKEDKTKRVIREVMGGDYDC